MDEYIFVAPAVSSEGKEFWEAAAAGRLMVKACRDCGQVFWYPRAICPSCLSGNTEWRETAGRGVIYSFSVVRGTGAYVPALVTLEEGVTILTNLVGADLAAIRIGAAVEVCFRPSDGGPPVPAFMPAA
jgi:uncharacterized OB-fold protein